MMKRHNGMERLPPGIGSTTTPSPPSNIGEGAGLGTMGVGTGNVASASGNVLYVDVVKNMPKPETTLLSRAKAPSAPEFSIFHEDFPALPGIGTGPSLRITTNSSQESSVVPDNWTDMISSDEDPNNDNSEAVKHAEINNNLNSPDDNSNDQDDVDDDDEDDDDDVEEIASDTPASASTASPLSTEDNVSMTSQRSSSSSNLSLKHVSSTLKSNMTVNEEQEKNIAMAILSHLHTKPAAAPPPPPPPPQPPQAPPTEAMPQMYEYWPQQGRRFVVSQIFDKQFICVGVRQRAINGMVKRPRKLDPSSPISTATTMPSGVTPSGYETSKIYARLHTNDQGMPLGGVKLDKIPPPNSNFSHSSSTSTTDTFGLLGLATNLGCANHSPQMFGDDPHRLNIDMHCCASSASSFNLHSAFAGPLLGGRCLPHDVSYDVPKVYRISDRLGLQQPKIHQMQVELLFFFFYNYPGDMMQMLAAAELAERSWRYHKYERLWLKRQPDNPNYLYRGQQEAGEYNYFNMIQWKILPRHFNLEPEHVERTITKTELLEQYGYHPQMRNIHYIPKYAKRTVAILKRQGLRIK